jgi:hypothetical protein
VELLPIDVAKLFGHESFINLDIHLMNHLFAEDLHEGRLTPNNFK